jgi:hypothetical protein
MAASPGLAFIGNTAGLELAERPAQRASARLSSVI